MTIKQKSDNSLNRCYLVTAGILMTGFGSAIAIYLTAPESSDNPFAEFEQSKRFSHEVQRMGGKMALVANDISSWFVELWHGRQLAYTVTGITLAIALGYYVIGSGKFPGENEDGTHDHDGSST
jgi:hypothetical protein